MHPLVGSRACAVKIGWLAYQLSLELDRRGVDDVQQKAVHQPASYASTGRNLRMSCQASHIEVRWRTVEAGAVVVRLDVRWLSNVSGQTRI